jgi:hypothetical protein
METEMSALNEKEETIRCTSFKPSAFNPAICKYRYMVIHGEDEECGCASTLYHGKICPTHGRNPQEQEEDSFE